MKSTMAAIRPFRALRYNPERISDLSTVITQPYDKISPAMQSLYYDLSPYNLARIIRGRTAPEDNAENTVHTRAARDFQSWIKEGVLAAEDEAAVYPYFQEYTIPGHASGVKERRGFIALCRLEDYSARIVHRHEETLSGPKADRMELLKRTRAHFGQVFFLYSDPSGQIEEALAPLTRRDPWEQLRDEYGTRHTVWRAADAATIDRVVSGMRDRKLIIADGHHRYETALAYRDLCRAEGHECERAGYVMATFVRMEASGLTILPTHRVVHGLPSFNWETFSEKAREAFDWNPLDSSPASAEGTAMIESKLRAAGRDRTAVAAYAGDGRLALLTLKPGFGVAAALPGLSDAERRLDVVVLHRLLIEHALSISAQAVREEKNLRYVRELREAVEEVSTGRAQVCFLMNSTPIEAVRDIAFGGRVMPQKSTDFYPKLLSGLTIYWLENPHGI